MSEFTMPEPNRFTLNLDKVGLSMPIAAGLQHPRMRIDEDRLLGQLTARLTAYVLSEHLAADTESATARVPDTWWDHAKHDLDAWAEGRWFYRPIAWWIRKRPVKERAVTLSVTWHRSATRPQSTIQVPDRLGPVVYQERTERDLRWH